MALKKFNVEHFSKISCRVLEIRKELDRVQCALQDIPSDPALLAEEARLSVSYGDLSRAEEGFNRQKSRVQWLNLGDQNSKFFFTAMKSFHGRSKVISITKEDGTRVEEDALVRDEIVSFFETLLGPQHGQQDF